MNNMSFIDPTEPGRSFNGEDEEQDRILELSEDTLTLIKEAWSGPLENSQRREIRNQYPVPDTQHTKTPKLDEIFSSSESLFAKNTEDKQTDRAVARIYAGCGQTTAVLNPFMDLVTDLRRDDICVNGL